MATTIEDFDSEVEAQLLEMPRRSKSWKKWAVGGSAAVLLCGAVGRFSYVKGVSAALESAQQKFQVIAPRGRKFCANTKDNCFDQGCCNVEGFTCFETKPGMAQCMKACNPLKYSCKQPQAMVDNVLDEGIVLPDQSMFCFAVVAVDTGAPKPSHELELMNQQAEMGVGIFQCDTSGLYSDGQIALNNGRPFTQVFERDGDWKFAKRKETGAWVNTGIFSDVWRAIQVEQVYANHQWIVKADPDAVFIVPRLKKMLTEQYEVASGSYLVNCPYVDYGFFGNLEVISKTAFQTLLDNLDVCKADASIDWKVGIKKGKYGPMGEDLFAQACMDAHNVKRVTNFGLSQDGACEAKRDADQRKNKLWQPHCDSAYGASFHPFKKTAEWKTCYDQTMAAFPQPK
jgi:hypothetical protein